MSECLVRGKIVYFNSDNKNGEIEIITEHSSQCRYQTENDRFELNENKIAPRTKIYKKWKLKSKNN